MRRWSSAGFDQSRRNPTSVAVAALVVALLATFAWGDAVRPAVALDGTRAAPDDGAIYGTWLVELAGPSVHDIIRSIRDPRPGIGVRTSTAGIIAGDPVGFSAPRMATPWAASWTRSLALRHDLLGTDLASRNVTVLASFTTAFNGLLVRAEREVARTLIDLPEVRAVYRVPADDTGVGGGAHSPDGRQSGRAMADLALGREARRPGVEPSERDVAAHHAARLTSVDQAPGATGDGPVVAIVGSGIDYTHAAFGGPGDPTAFESNDPDVVEADTFPTDVVVGGVDLAGALYTAACPQPLPPDVACASEPAPDDDPLDHANGLGTALAGAVLDAAPGARLVAIRIVGDPIGVDATSALYLNALEWVARHNIGLAVSGSPPDAPIDVLLVQSGRAWAGGWAPLARAVRTATDSGVVTVAPLGDHGDVPFMASAPGVAPSALSVAAAYGEDDTVWGIRAGWSDESGPVALQIAATDALDPMPGFRTGRPITATLAWYGLACTQDGEAPPPEQDVGEKIALIERGACTFSEKSLNAQTHGALGVVMFTDGRDRIAPRCGGSCPDSLEIPTLMIDRPPGLRLREALRDGAEITVRIDPTYYVPLGGRILDASGRGPGRAAGGGLAPAMTADGVEVTVPIAGTGDRTALLDGTSVAAARTAGLVARLAGERRASGGDLDALSLASLAAAYASQPVIDGATGRSVPVARQGAGMLDADASLAGETVALGEGGARGLTFDGRFTSDRGLPSRALAIRNHSTDPKRYSVGFELTHPDDDAGQGVEVHVRPTTLEVPAGARATIDVLLEADLEAMRPWDLDDGRALLEPERVTRLEVDGWVHITEIADDGSTREGGDALRVPVHVLPRGATCAAPTERIETIVLEQPDAARSIRIRNPCGGHGELRPGLMAGRDGEESADRATAGEFPASLDVSSVGMRYGPGEPDDPASSPVIEWLVRTRGARRLPIEVSIDILLDLDRDGRVDRILSTVHGPDFRPGYGVGDFRVIHTVPIPGTLLPDESRALPDPLPLRWDFDESVTAVRARAEELLIDLRSGGESFAFGVRVRDGVGDYPITEGFPGYDTAPDGLADGEMFTFEQERFECLAIRDAAGERVDVPGGAVPLPRGGEAELLLSWEGSCEAAGAGALMIGSPADRALAGQSVLWPVRWGWPSVYLPYGAVAR